MPSVESRKPRKAPKLNPTRRLERQAHSLSDPVIPFGRSPGLLGLLRMPDVCALLGMRRAAVRRLMREHGLRYVRVGRELRFRRQWIEEFIDRNTSTPRRRGR